MDKYTFHGWKFTSVKIIENQTADLENEIHEGILQSERWFFQFTFV